jgi:orotate phosphoribosyltransferase
MDNDKRKALLELLAHHSHATVTVAFALVDRGDGAARAFASERSKYSRLFTAEEVRQAARG